MNFQEMMARIEPFRYSHDLNSLEATVEPIATESESQGDETFVRFLLAVCDMLSSYDFGDYTRQSLLMHQYANRALQKSASLPLDLELQVLAHLEHDFEEDSASMPWPEKRQARAVRILGALDKMGEGASYEVQPEEMPLINVPSPPSARLPAGAAPDTIHNHLVRRKYQADLNANEQKAEALRNRWGLRRLHEKYAPGLIRTLIRSYQREPANPSELQRLVSEHLSDGVQKQSLSERIVSPA